MPQERFPRTGGLLLIEELPVRTLLARYVSLAALGVALTLIGTAVGIALDNRVKIAGALIALAIVLLRLGSARVDAKSSHAR
jgi:hypothetical protein